MVEDDGASAGSPTGSSATRTDEDSIFEGLREEPEFAGGDGEPDGDDEEKKPRGWPGGKKRGRCQKCGAKADGPSATWCAKHRPLKPDRQPEPSGGRSRPRAATSIKALQKELTTQIEMAAMLWAMRDPECASVLLPRDFDIPVQFPDGTTAVLKGQGHGAIIAEYWAGRAEASPAVHRALAQIVGTTGWLGAITVHAPLLIAVWGHHVEPRLQARRVAAEAAANGQSADVAGDGAAERPAA